MVYVAFCPYTPPPVLGRLMILLSKLGDASIAAQCSWPALRVEHYVSWMVGIDACMDACALWEMRARFRHAEHVRPPG
jgi:hypothetical protein